MKLLIESHQGNSYDIISIIELYLKVVYKTFKEHGNLLIASIQTILNSNKLELISQNYIIQDNIINVVELSFILIKFDARIHENYDNIELKYDADYLAYISNINIDNIIKKSITFVLNYTMEKSTFKNNLTSNTRSILKVIATIVRSQSRSNIISNITNSIAEIIVKIFIELDILDLDDKTQNNIATIINLLKKVENVILNSCNDITQERNFHIAINLLSLPFLEKKVKRNLFLYFIQFAENNYINPEIFIKVVSKNLILLKTTSNALFEVIIDRITHFINIPGYNVDEQTLVHLFKMLNRLINKENMKNYVFNNIEVFVNMYNWLKNIENEALYEFIENLVKMHSNDLNKYSEKIINILIQNTIQSLNSSKYYITHNHLNLIKHHIEYLEYSGHDFYLALTDELIRMLNYHIDTPLKSFVITIFAIIIEKNEDIKITTYIWNNLKAYLYFNNKEIFEENARLISAILSQIHTNKNINSQIQIIHQAQLSLQNISPIIETLTMTGLGRITRNRK